MLDTIKTIADMMTVEVGIGVLVGYIVYCVYATGNLFPRVY